MSRHSKEVWGTKAANPLELDAQRVRELRQLCHPDRHGNSHLSVRVTQWLADVSKELDSKAAAGR